MGVYSQCGIGILPPQLDLFIHMFITRGGGTQTLYFSKSSKTTVNTLLQLKVLHSEIPKVKLLIVQHGNSRIMHSIVLMHKCFHHLNVEAG